MAIYRVMVNNDNDMHVEIAGENHPFTYNLADVPQMVDSKSYAGIQIADVFAGALAFVLNQNQKIILMCGYRL